uniref:non-specific serine/threonine protein kinase n=1 Tax=Cajanus cajan TaxID=3821 RepID=A0A151RU68_CAJCA|nr:Lectin-domain containing receptor kinase A4.2 [Cajanus cajan]
MAPKTLFGLLIFLILLVSSTAFSFQFHGFNNTKNNLTLEGDSKVVEPQGTLKLTERVNNIFGHAFYNEPIKMIEQTNASSPQPKVSSFSTCFVFSIVSPSSGLGGFGLAFTIAPKTHFPEAEGGHLLGLFNSANDMNASNHILVVEFDTVNGHKGEFDTKGNHVGVNLNGMLSSTMEPAAYFKRGTKEEFNMEEADAVCAWIEYDGETEILNVTIAPFKEPKPSKPLISEFIDIKYVMRENMYFGFSASTVYDYIPNGSLDSLLFNKNFALDWDKRFNILKGVAAGLLYLHEEWEKVVIHRDVKSSNILIDGDFNARLGDFGLARLYSHEQVSHTTSVVGTIGYIAPELTRTGKASASSDVYAFGVLLLEVVAGTRPVESSGQFLLVDWILENSQLGQILEVVDPKLGSVYDEEQVELVLKLGLLCTQHKADHRPSMKQLTRYLNFDDPLPHTSEWRHCDSQSSTTSFGFLEAMNSGMIASSQSLSSIGRSTMSIEDCR